ncbi:hypothetical protein JCM10550A_15280 [Methanogenium cariaci]
MRSEAAFNDRNIVLGIVNTITGSSSAIPICIRQFGALSTEQFVSPNAENGSEMSTISGV